MSNTFLGLGIVDTFLAIMKFRAWKGIQTFLNSQCTLGKYILAIH